MSVNTDLELMKRKWESLGIQKHFSKVHHFASDKFATNPSSLNVFYNWCTKREIMDENSQTLQRALTTATLFEGGQSIEQSIETAWKNHPIIKR